MLSGTFTIRDEFPSVDYDQWRALVEADLKGAPFDKKLVTRTHEGILVQPIYASKDFPGGSDPHGFPGIPPFVRNVGRYRRYTAVYAASKLRCRLQNGYTVAFQLLT